MKPKTKIENRNCLSAAYCFNTLYPAKKIDPGNKGPGNFQPFRRSVWRISGPSSAPFRCALRWAVYNCCQGIERNNNSTVFLQGRVERNNTSTVEVLVLC
jgi:hypothetical protein